ncbi:hypothetical protein [Methanolapillus ohkumae]|uniref:HD domain-containing protein n=1 Tax=Methanolapillus ohkumae TaxID=3028298 RepID=A0AA96V6C7_9EURY|nr:hypothetical protein MsAm2_00850 [Methanosarcinaceae archaeon Am2]
MTENLLDKSVIDEYKNSIYLACAGAYLHNLGKITPEFIKYQKNTLGDEKYCFQLISGILSNIKDPSKIKVIEEIFKTVPSNHVFLEGTKKWLINNKIELMSPLDDRTYCMGDILEFLGVHDKCNCDKLYNNAGREEIRNFKDTDLLKIAKKDKILKLNLILDSTSLLTHLMKLCHHGASGGEKQSIFSENPSGDFIYISTPFGREKQIDEKTYWCLKKSVEEKLQQTDANNLETFINFFEPMFKEAVADTQRPINNISIHDIGHTGMAFLKSGIWTLAIRWPKVTHDEFNKCLGKERNYLKLWRLLSYRIDGQSFLFDATNLSDFKTRKNALENDLNNIQNRIEFRYPIATEIYRDENGSAFIYPDLEEVADELKSTISKLSQYNLSLHENISSN